MAEDTSPEDARSARTNGSGLVLEKSQSWGRGLNLRGWTRRILATIRKVPAVVVGTWIIVTLLTLVFQRQSLELDTVGVPKSLVDSGFTSEVATQHLRDAILLVQDSANTYMRKAAVEEPGFSDIVLPETGLSLGSIGATLRSFIPSWRHEISGEFIASDNRLALRVRMNGRVIFSQSAVPISADTADTLIASGVQGAAFAVVRRAQPYVAAVMLFDKGDLNGAESALKGIPEGNENWLWAQNLIGSIIYERGGECTIAKDYFDKALKISVAQETLAVLYDDADCEYYDPKQSVLYYQRAIKLNPKMEEAYTGLGSAFINNNDMGDALISYNKAIAMNPLDPNAHLGVAEIFLSRNDPEGALSEYDNARGIDYQLIQQDDADRTWQSGLASADRSSGRILSVENEIDSLDKAQSDLTAADTIDRALSNQDPLDAAFKAHWAEDERYLGDVQAKLEGLYESRADRTAAAMYYQKAEAYYREAESIDASISVGRYNLRWRRDFGSDYREEGVLALSTGNAPSALSSFEKAKSIDIVFTGKPTNSVWPIFLANDDGDIGDAFAAEQAWPSALSAYQSAQSIAQTLAHRDSSNQNFQRDILVYGLATGDMFQQTNNPSQALFEYRLVNATAGDLAAHEKSNTFWKQELSASYSSMSQVLKAERDLPAALQASLDARKVDRALINQDGSEPKWKLFVVWDDRDIAVLLKLQRNVSGALSAYRDAQSTDQSMAKTVAGPNANDWMHSFAEDTAAIDALSRLATK